MKIIVSHDVQETLDIADYVYVIADGRIIGEGDAQKVNNDKSPFVNQFIHGLADGPVPLHYPAKNYGEDLGL